MELRELIKRDFGIDLPFKGGKNISIDNPIVILKEAGKNYLSIEYEILKYIGLGRGIIWKILSQSIQFHKNRVIDKIQIEALIFEKNFGDEHFQLENYYFDITECWEKK